MTDRSVVSIARYVLDVAWRRRHLLLIPMLLSVPLGVGIASMVPATYVARSLLLLQESAGANPSAPNYDWNDKPADRAAGLKALLKSESLLTTALRDIRGQKFPTDPRQLAQQLDDLNKAVSLEIIGNEFMEFTLKGSEPKGMGKTLEIITTRFLESLLVPEQNARSAPRALLDRAKQDLDTTVRALAEFRVTHPNAELLSAADDKLRLQLLTQSNSIATAEFESIAAELDAMKEDIAALPAADTFGTDTKKVSAKVTELGATSGAGPELESARDLLAALQKADEIGALNATKQREIARIESDMKQLAAAISEKESIIELRKTLLQNERDAKARQEMFQRRFGDLVSTRALNILKAPEQIRVIDPAKDPELPTTSKMKFVIASILAGIALGFSLAVVGEALDQSVRRLDDFEKLTGAPVVARLPANPMDDETSVQQSVANEKNTPVASNPQRSRAPWQREAARRAAS